jgi:hypothetical protein
MSDIIFLTYLFQLNPDTYFGYPGIACLSISVEVILVSSVRLRWSAERIITVCVNANMYSAAVRTFGSF